jgi:hypothetical protein
MSDDPSGEPERSEEQKDHAEIWRNVFGPLNILEG